MNLDVMLIDACNLRCPMCQHVKNTTGKFMSLEQISSILDQMVNLDTVIGKRFDTIRLDGNREALLYPHLEEVMSIAKSKGIGTLLITNGVLLDKEKASMLVRHGLKHIIISVTGITTDVYRQFQGANTKNPTEQLDKVKENVEHLVQFRDSAKSRMKVDISYILTEHSVVDANSAVFYWKDKGCDEIKFNVNTMDAVYARECKTDDFYYHPGSKCISSAGVAVNGDVYPCCQPPGEYMSIGNCFETTLSDIFSSKAYYDLVSALATLDPKNMPQGCITCPVICSKNPTRKSTPPIIDRGF